MADHLKTPAAYARWLLGQSRERLEGGATATETHHVPLKFDPAEVMMFMAMILKARDPDVCMTEDDNTRSGRSRLSIMPSSRSDLGMWIARRYSTSPNILIDHKLVCEIMEDTND